MFLFLFSGVGLFWLGLWVGSKSQAIYPAPPFMAPKPPPAMTEEEIEQAKANEIEDRPSPMPFMEKKQ